MLSASQLSIIATMEGFFSYENSEAADLVSVYSSIFISYDLCTFELASYTMGTL